MSGTQTAPPEDPNTNTTTKTVDVVVVGSGGAGLTAATVAALAGLDVLLVEKTAWFGGTTALSGGGIWVPGHHLGEIGTDSGTDSTTDITPNNADGDSQQALRYVREVVGPTLRDDLLQAFLDAAPKMVDLLVRRTAVRFTVQQGFPDWHPQAGGFSASGRLLSPETYDGRLLGEHFLQLRPALTEFNAPGGMMIGLGDMPHIAQVRRSWASFRHMAGLLLRYGRDRLRYPRGTRLTMGNALAARLLRSALDAGVTLWRNTPMQRLLISEGRVRGVEIDHAGQRLTVHTRRGVVLASGGFSANAQWRQRYIPFADQHVSLVPEGNTGDGLSQALDAGARFDGDNHSNAGWVVVSVHRQPDGRLRKFPHLFLDRGKPGCIAVNQAGQRFGNEAATNLVEPMHRTGSVPAFLLCDDRFIRKYGLGLVRPGGIGLKRLLAEGYLRSAPTLAALAQLLSLPAEALQATVARFNEHARTGQDPDFGRGSQAADFNMGDRHHQPNPCLGPIDHGPFYAVQVFPGDSTTTVGLRVDREARVLDANDQPIIGLHAAGLDMNSLWRGRAPANGANNTLGLTFGYIAATALARQAPAETQP